MPKLEIVAYKKVRGHDGQGFNATLAIDGVKACHVDDDGWGGGFAYTWLSKDEKVNKANQDKLREAAKEAFLKEARNKGKDPNDPKNHVGEYDDIVVGELVDDFAQLKKLRDLCKKKTVAVLPSDKAGQYGTFNVPFSPQLKAQLEKKYAGIRFFNEHLEDGKWRELLQLDKLKEQEDAEIEKQIDAE